MQFGRVLSDSSDSETVFTVGSQSLHLSEQNGMNNNISGSDIPSDEEEDDDSEDVKVSHYIALTNSPTVKWTDINISLACVIHTNHSSLLHLTCRKYC